MSNKRIYLIIFCIIITVFPSCQKNQPSSSDTVVIGNSSGIEPLNPSYSYTISEGSISELIYMSPVQYDRNEYYRGMDVYLIPAERFERNPATSAIAFKLKKTTAG